MQMIHFDNENIEPASDCVVIRIQDNDTLSTKSSGFVIGDDALRNLRVGFAQILKLGSEARVNTNLKEGDWVFYDTLSTFYHTYPIAVLRYQGLIMESNQEKTKYRAMGGRCIVQEVASTDESKAGFVIPTSDEMKIGVIKSITPPYTATSDSIPFKVGDKVLLTKDERDTLHGFRGDADLDPTKPIHIYKTEHIICKIND